MNLFDKSKMTQSTYRPPFVGLQFLLLSLMVFLGQNMHSILSAQETKSVQAENSIQEPVEQPDSGKGKGSEKDMAKPAASSGGKRFVTSGKQHFQNQLMMRELQLLRNQSLTSNHLKLSATQLEKIKEVEQGFQSELTAVGQDRSIKVPERAEKLQELVANADQRLSELMSPEQKKRLEQIALQSFGTAPGQDSLPALNLIGNADFRSYLEVSEATEKKLRQTLWEENRRMQQEIAKLKSQSNDTVLATLSEDEKKRFIELLGEPFEFGKRRGTQSSNQAESQDK